jgi:hypothetical protein
LRLQQHAHDKWNQFRIGYRFRFREWIGIRGLWVRIRRFGIRWKRLGRIRIRRFRKFRQWIRFRLRLRSRRSGLR